MMMSKISGGKRGPDSFKFALADWQLLDENVNKPLVTEAPGVHDWVIQSL
jgi:hypothetical protein